MRSLGWEQWWIAERLGVHPRTVSRWLSGRTPRIRRRHLAALAELLAIDQRFLIAVEDDEDADTDLDAAREAIEQNNLTELLTPSGELETAERIVRALLHGERDPRRRASLLVQLAIALFRQGKYSASYGAASQAYSLAERTGEPRTELRATMLLGHHYFASGDLPRCIETYRHCLDTARSLNDDLNVAANISNLGDVLRDEGDFGEARLLIEDAIARYGALGRALNASIAWAHLCELEFEAGTREAQTRAVLGLGQASFEANHAYGKHRHAMFELELEVSADAAAVRRAPSVGALARLESSAPETSRAVTALHAARICRRGGLLDAAQAFLGDAETHAMTQPVLRAHIALEWSRTCPTSTWADVAAARFQLVGARSRVR